MYLNKAMIIGNLTQDPELKSLPSGVQVANFSVATNRYYKDKDGNKQEQTEFHNIVAFGKLGELSAQYLAKGRQAYVEGRLQTRSWDGQDGNKKYRTEIIAESVQFGQNTSGGGSAGSDQGAQQNTAAQQPAGQQQGGQEQQGEQVNYPDEEINPEDIPF